MFAKWVEVIIFFILQNPLKVDDSSKCVEIVDAKVSNAEATKAPAIECQVQLVFVCLICKYLVG